MSRLKHQQSHASLLRNVSTGFVPPTRSGLDAIVVPAARASLQRAISLSAELSVPLVLLCSKQAKIEKVAERVEGTFGARALIVEVPEGYRLPQHDKHFTSDPSFAELSAGRSSDLSVKRNIGLLLARMRGWNKILFLDDDISSISGQDIERLAGCLDRHPVASMASRYFPDNSVVCHARRLAGIKQDVFVSGAVLGVNTQHPAMSFFPDVYNEDWFFFARHAAARTLPKIGEVKQDEYQPFADPERAAREEFGDLLAEGMYALFESMPGWDFDEQLSAASSRRHWERFKLNRKAIIAETSARLDDCLDSAVSKDYPLILQAQQSLEYARRQLREVSPQACVDFLDSWRTDERRWHEVLADCVSVRGERDALDELELRNWISCGFGIGRSSARPRPVPAFQPEPDLCAAGGVGEKLSFAGGLEA